MAKVTAAPIDLDSLLGKAKNRIVLVGVELEGAWTKLPPNTIPERDGSVMVPRPANLKSGSEFHPGEIALEPLPIDKVPTFVEKFYPQVVNASCGLHVHMSFKNALHYQILMVPEFQATILEYLGRWATKTKLGTSHPIWARLSGSNTYCKDEFFPDDQAKQKGKAYDRQVEGNRYTAINYPFNYQGTVECRVLPMFDTPKLANEAISTVLNVTNAFLAAQRGKGPVVGGTCTYGKDVNDHPVVTRTTSAMEPRVERTVDYE